MKIRDVDMTPLELKSGTPIETKREAPIPAQAFQRQLTDLSQDRFLVQVRELADEIFRQGEKVAKRADIKELQKYREMITQLLNETVSNGFAFTKKGTFDSHGKHRVFALINKINAKLDEITNSLLEGQKDNIALLHAVDDIRGMLVDLLY